MDLLSRKYLLATLITVAIAGSSPSFAADTTITVNGKVVAAACTVGLGLGAGQTVELGTLGRTRFQHASDKGDWKSFSLNLTHCPAGTGQSTVTFTGIPDGTDATLFANTEPVATAASHIAIQMAKDSDRSAILSSGSAMTVNVDTLAGTATFPLAARLYTPSGGVQAGQVSSSVLVNFTYQ